MTPPKCIFCENQSGSEEHLWSAWMHRLSKFGPILVREADDPDVIEVDPEKTINTICQHCKTEQKVDHDYLRRVGFPEADIGVAKIWHGAGCEECRQQGYQGRKGIYELLIVTEALRPLIMNRAPATTIAQRAIDHRARLCSRGG